MEVKPTKNIRLSLGLIEKKYKTLLTTPIAVVIEISGTQIVVHSTGTLLFKKERNQKIIEKVAKEIYTYKQ